MFFDNFHLIGISYCVHNNGIFNSFIAFIIRYHFDCYIPIYSSYTHICLYIEHQIFACITYHMYMKCERSKLFHVHVQHVIKIKYNNKIYYFIRMNFVDHRSLTQLSMICSMCFSFMHSIAFNVMANLFEIYSNLRKIESIKFKRFNYDDR